MANSDVGVVDVIVEFEPGAGLMVTSGKGSFVWCDDPLALLLLEMAVIDMESIGSTDSTCSTRFVAATVMAVLVFCVVVGIES